MHRRIIETGLPIISRMGALRRNYIAAEASNSAPGYEKSEINLWKEEFRNFAGGAIELKMDNSTGLAFICLKHADRKNSLSGKMMAELHDSVVDLETWQQGKGLILHSDGDAFCSGGYIETVKQIMTPEAGYKMSCLMHDSILRLRSLPLVSFAVVQGKAIGGGAELMLSTDFRLFTPLTQVQFVQTKMGVTTGWAGGTLLQRLVGHQKALDLLLTADKVLAEEAVEIGLANGIINHETRMQEAELLLLAKVGKLDSSIVQAAKSVIVCNDFAVERRIVSQVWGNKIQKEMFSAGTKHK